VGTRGSAIFIGLPRRELGFEIHAGSLAAAKGRAVKAGIAAAMIDDLVARLRAAKAGGYEWMTPPFLLDLVLRKPQPMRRPGGGAQPPAR
jgi:hypothetical protein